MVGGCQASRDKKVTLTEESSPPKRLFIGPLLTYMATLEDALATAVLEPFELPDWELRLPIHSLYVTPDFVKWGDDTTALHDKNFSIGGRTLFEHLVQTLCDFRCMEQFHCGDLRRLMPTSKGVWSMHAPGLRIYGWCPKQHEFVAVTGATEADTKKYKTLNAQKRKYVEQFIRQHSLNQTVLRGDILAVFPHHN